MTNLTVSDLETKANQHEQTAESVKAEQKKLAADIQALVGPNQGDMMVALQNLHQQWQEQMTRVVNDLLSMAQTLREGARKLQQGDVDNGAQLKPLEGAIPMSSGSPATPMSSFLS
ncbi:WXG100 family type VII secretion target [Saccharopolyspora sp. K220]|uniref:WXG100 family type VII secretion target n=1 Tax=Saccharopolyspora soli TaxID=2926618 RepID=UPI001F58E4F9|nr:WXG100 family type VII secretion target [Saccharopolyspora soli]MCI2417475.1 WXG100 family type VII secretion target [Saccharopolyspora soli]